MNRPPFLGGLEDLHWCTDTQFGSGIAKAVVLHISASGGGEVCIELDYAYLVERLEFTELELRAAVGRLIHHGHARINSRHQYYEGDVLELLTPGRRADDARIAQENKEKERRRAAKIALRGGQVNRAPIAADLRNFIFARDNHACRRCGATEDLTLDHIHPWSIGGPDTAENLQVLCRSCNSSKGARV